MMNSKSQILDETVLRTVCACMKSKLLSHQTVHEFKGNDRRLPAELQCSPSTISRELKVMGYPRKRLKSIVVARNSERVISEQHAYALHFTNLQDEEAIKWT